MFAPYGILRTAGSKLITYGGVFLARRCALRRWTKVVLPDPAIPMQIMVLSVILSRVVDLIWFDLSRSSSFFFVIVAIWSFSFKLLYTPLVIIFVQNNYVMRLPYFCKKFTAFFPSLFKVA